jgi:hypothetical protein
MQRKYIFANAEFLILSTAVLSAAASATPPQARPSKYRQKTSSRLMETIRNLDFVPPGRRVGGPWGRYLMAPFTHASAERPSRFSDGRYGVLYAVNRFKVALLETVHHHGRFMARTQEPPEWISQFREICLRV